jgi:hypothetical protein
MSKESRILKTTKAWVEQFVIGLNLCPFARHPFKHNKIRYVVFDGDDLEKLTEVLIQELREMDIMTPSVLETTLIVLPDCLADFEAYLDFIEVAEYVVSALDFEGAIQVASFHPGYQFEGTNLLDVENYTNRSPYPMLHLLREDSVTRAIEAYPEHADIPARNIDTMNKMGLTRVKQLLDEISRTS